MWRSLGWGGRGRRAEPAFAQNSAVDDNGQYASRKCGPVGRGETGGSEDAKTPLCTTWRYGFARSRRDLTICVAKGGACSSGCAKHRCRRRWPKCYAKVWPLIGRGETGRSEDAKTTLCTTWRYGFARTSVAKCGACSSRFFFRKAASHPWRPGSAL